MVFQYKNEKPLHFGSADVRFASYNDQDTTYVNAESIGMLDGVTFNVTGDDTVIETDNHDDIPLGLSNQRVEIGASAWKNFDAEVLYKLLGKTGTYATTPAGARAVTDELVKLKETVAIPLGHKNEGTPATVVTGVIVKNASGDTTYTEDTDYVLGLTPEGYTTILKVEGGNITTGSTVKVSYNHTGLASKTLTYGSSTKPEFLHAWIINTDENGKKFIIEIYKVSAMTSAAFTFGSDKRKQLLAMPVSIIGRPDSSRAANDDLFRIIDEQGV